MVFDLSNVDEPTLLGRIPIFGTPLEMAVWGNVVVIVVSDWGQSADGTLFPGSFVRGYDASDPGSIQSIGEVAVRGLVQDSRVLGHPASDSGVLYMLSAETGLSYEFDPIKGFTASATDEALSVAVTCVTFGPAGLRKADEKEFPSRLGYRAARFYVTDGAILLAHDDVPDEPDAGQTDSPMRLVYLDITDTAGAIRERGSVAVNGVPAGSWGDRNRNYLDFADQAYAHVYLCVGSCVEFLFGSYHLLQTVDFTDPDHPVLASELRIESVVDGSSAAEVSGAGSATIAPPFGLDDTILFDRNRMYRSLETYAEASLPVEIYDLSDPAAPKLASKPRLPGSAELFVPSGSGLFTVSTQFVRTTESSRGRQASLSYLDVTDASAPRIIDTVVFGQDAAETTTARTVEAFTEDDGRGLLVLPFNSRSRTESTHDNGLQLFEFEPPSTSGSGSLTLSGAAHTRGWVVRGLRVDDRLVSLGNETLAVIDDSDRANPVVVNELTLARRVLDVVPQTDALLELSSEWWDSEASTSALRVRPLDDPEENRLEPKPPELSIPGSGTRVFTNGSGALAYVVTCAELPVAGATSSEWRTSVHVVDRSTPEPSLRGNVELPGSWCFSFHSGFDISDWLDGDSIVQLGDDLLAFWRWAPSMVADPRRQSLYVVDVSDPDQPTLGSTSIADPSSGWWWGNMRVVDGTLYVTHHEGVFAPTDEAASAAQYSSVYQGRIAYMPPDQTEPGLYVSYYLDRIDLSDPTHPRVQSSINVPGLVVGAREADPSIMFTIDFRYDDEFGLYDQLDVVRIQAEQAEILSAVPLGGYAGRPVVQADQVYVSVYVVDSSGPSQLELHQIDLSDPTQPVDSVVDEQPMGWLLDVAGDRVFLTSTWTEGIDIYRLSEGAPPVFERFVRAHRSDQWSPLKRWNDTVYLPTGYWGVQAVQLE
jgi:hypothetical protein